MAGDAEDRQADQPKHCRANAEAVLCLFAHHPVDGMETAKGYMAADLQEAFERYLPPSPHPLFTVTASQRPWQLHRSHFAIVTKPIPVQLAAFLGKADGRSSCVLNRTFVA